MIARLSSAPLFAVVLLLTAEQASAGRTCRTSCQPCCKSRSTSFTLSQPFHHSCTNPVVKIKIRNSSGIDVRFIGVHFDGSHFRCDVADGKMASVTRVKNGSIALTAYRVSDQIALDTLRYGVSDTQGFAAVLVQDPSDPYRPYKLVGEGFEIPKPKCAASCATSK
jgi:hypothetical protein